MRKRGLCCRPVSVRPSVTLADCIQTAEDIVKLLSRPGSPIYSFLTPSAGTQFEGDPCSGGAKYKGSARLLAVFILGIHRGGGTFTPKNLIFPSKKPIKFFFVFLGLELSIVTKS